MPISLKDQFNVEGYDSTLGYVGRAGKPASSNALLVDVLQRLGAIVLAKTNLPQSILVQEADRYLSSRVLMLTSGAKPKTRCGV